MKSRIDKTEYTLDKYTTGTMAWRKDGESHRDKDLPAIIYRTGDMFWCKNGVYHRDNDLPAIIWGNGNMYWFKNGKFIKSE